VKDRLGREIEYLRISVTQNCNLHCMYCNPDICSKDDNQCGTGLSPEEIGAVVSAMSELGIHKVRITGGEPLLRSDILDILREVSSVPDIDDISMTTNGIKLGRMAKDLKKAGLGRLNISLDSLREDRLKEITGGGRLKDVMWGIEAAVEADLKPVRINVVLIKGVNDDEIQDFINLATYQDIDVRFIELMPVGAFGEQNRDKVVLNSDIIASIPGLIPSENGSPGQPARYFRLEGMKGRIGFISPMSHKFCSTCNRIRLTCDGKLKPCLGNNHEMDITGPLKKGRGQLLSVIRQAIFDKPEGHCFENEFVSVRRMSGIGG
jgi:cyclic pyranopterin phosphate synthase